ncbi:MAG: hypothetical protein ACRD30_03265 [Bryobacteraceae bacterium]
MDRNRAKARLTAALCGAIVFSQISGAQTVLLDWQARSKIASQTLKSTEPITFKIANVNDIFYTYRVSCAATAKDEANLYSMFNILAAPRTEAIPLGCDRNARDLLKRVQDYLRLPAACGNNCAGIPLSDAKEQIEIFVQEIDEALKCAVASSEQLTKTRNQLKALLNLDHMLTFQSPMSNTCTVGEFYKDRPTADGKLILSIQKSAVTIADPRPPAPFRPRPQPPGTETISTDPPSLDFGTLGAMPIEQTIQITNRGDRTADIGVYLEDPSSPLELGGTSGCLHLGSGNSCSVPLTLGPGSGEPRGTILKIVSNGDFLHPHTVAVTWK